LLSIPYLFPGKQLAGIGSGNPKFINKAKDNFYKDPFCYWKNWTKLISGMKNNNE